MLSPKLVLLAALAYVAILFAVAFFCDRQAKRGQLGFLQSPLVYTLSLSIYCTSWTFYGAVGSAARNGLEFITIYLGPTLVFAGWWFFLRKLVRVGRVHRVTSIADLISSRYGKSTIIAVVVTLIAVIGTTPYIALQLKALTISFQVVGNAADALDPAELGRTDFVTAFWIAVGMAIFTIIFGTRNIDANERHHGVVAAIALEAIVKLTALLAVGLFVVFAIGDGIGNAFKMPDPELIQRRRRIWPALGNTDIPCGCRDLLSASTVSGHGRREHRRGPSAHGFLAVSSLSLPDQPVHTTDRPCRPRQSFAERRS